MSLDESMDITTANEQEVQSDFTDVETRNEAFRKIVTEKPLLLIGSTSVCQMEFEIERELVSHDAERKMTSCTESECTCKLQHDEGRYFLHEHCQSE